MLRYKRKTDEVEAVQLNVENVQEVAQWCGGQAVEEIDPFDSSKRYPAVNVPGLAGMFRLSDGDFIIKDPSLGFYKVGKDTFNHLYEPV